jgi:hypothetical protein
MPEPTVWSTTPADYAGKDFDDCGGTDWPAYVVEKIILGEFTDAVNDGRLDDLEALHARTESTLTSVPAFSDRCLTYPDAVTGHHDYTLSVASGRLRFTASATTTDTNMRRAYGYLPSGVMGDSEVRSTFYATNLDWDGVGRYQPGHVHRMRSQKVVLDSGLATSGAATTLTDTGKSWATSPAQFAGAVQGGKEVYVQIVAGTGIGQKRHVISNTATALTVDTAWTTNPDSTSRYEVYAYSVNAIVMTVGPIGFGIHAGLQPTAFENGNYSSTNFSAAGADLTGYLGMTPSETALPWKMKSRLTGNRLEAVMWAASDSEPAYGASGKSYDGTIPAGWGDEPGMSGLYVGHLGYVSSVSDWVEFDDITITEL